MRSLLGFRDALDARRLAPRCGSLTRLDTCYGPAEFSRPLIAVGECENKIVKWRSDDEAFYTFPSGDRG